MDPPREEDVFADAEDPFPLKEEQEDEEEEEEEEVDAKIFNTWMQQFRGGDHQKKLAQEEKDEEEEEDDVESEGERPESRCGLEPPVQMRTDRRSSLPCPVRNMSTQKVSAEHQSG